VRGGAGPGEGGVRGGARVLRPAPPLTNYPALGPCRLQWTAGQCSAVQCKARHLQPTGTDYGWCRTLLSPFPVHCTALHCTVMGPVRSIGAAGETWLRPARPGVSASPVYRPYYTEAHTPYTIDTSYLIRPLEITQ
jgi:hypothetical protein